jgi:hypothetical protein
MVNKPTENFSAFRLMFVAKRDVFEDAETGHLVITKEKRAYFKNRVVPKRVGTI